MKILFNLLILILTPLIIFSQTTNIISLDDCLKAAVETHPLNNKRSKINSALEKQNGILSKDKLPSIGWNTQVRLQSENVNLEFDNPMISNIELPLYSFQSTLDLNYTIYDGKRVSKLMEINKALSASQLGQVDIEVDAIKAEVLKSYMYILMFQEKDSVLKNMLERIQNNIKSLEGALKNGVLKKSDLLLLQVKAKEIENEIAANIMDRRASITYLSSVCNLELTEKSNFQIPEPGAISIDQVIQRKELDRLSLEQAVLKQKEQLSDLRKQPMVFAFASGGFGYPNPLNFFDDGVSPFAVGGIKFSWKFIDYGKSKEEKQLLKIQQELLEIQKESISKMINDRNEQFNIGILKIRELVKGEEELLKMKEEISSIQKHSMEQGVIIPTEYVSTLNDIIDSKLKMRSYELQLKSLKLEYLLLKGQL